MNNRNNKVKQFKEKQKQKIMNQELQNVRPIPVWKSTDKIELSGLEFEVINNFINSVQASYGAIQSVMNRNILSGVISLDFEKLNEDKTAYVEMSDEEKAPHIAEYQKILEAARLQKAGLVSAPSISDELTPVTEDKIIQSL